MGILYRLDFSNGKSYIGITTKTMEERFNNHRRSVTLYSSALLVHKAWRKYGPPDAKILVVAGDEYLPSLEIKAINAFGTLDPMGYNLSYGGEISPMKNPVTAAKVSLANKGKPGTFTGKTHTEESKEKNRQAHLGKTLTEEHRAKIATAGIGRVTSEETKAKISASNSGKPRSPEYRAKIAATLTKDPLATVEPVKLERKAANGKALWSTCKHGHLLTGDNLIITHEGKYEKRRCKECGRLRTQKYRSKQHEIS